MKSTVSMTVIYAIAALAALILMTGYWRLIKQKETWIQCLYFSVFGVNVGYFLLSISAAWQAVLFANGIVYLFSVCLPFFMLMAILSVCGLSCSKRFFAVLILSGGLLFGLTASSAYQMFSASEVQLEFAHGAAGWIRQCGMLHSLFGLYLFLYFAGMLGVILYTVKKKKCSSCKLAFFLLAAAGCNLLTGVLEELIPMDFEFLAVSYVFTGLLLLLQYLILEETVVDGAKQMLDSAASAAVGVLNGSSKSIEPGTFSVSSGASGSVESGTFSVSDGASGSVEPSGSDGASVFRIAGESGAFNIAGVSNGPSRSVGLNAVGASNVRNDVVSNDFGDNFTYIKRSNESENLDYIKRSNESENFADSKRNDESEKTDTSSETIVGQIQTRTEGTDLTGIEKLSVREMEVLLLIMDNKKRKNIAEELEITENTVKKHTSHIFSKLGVSSRKELFAKCSHVSEEEDGAEK